MEIKQLITDCQNDEPKAQEQLYKLFSSKMFSVCLKYSRNYEEAQDNLQEGFLLAFNKIQQYNFQGAFEGWLKRLIINNILRQYRNSVVFEVIKDNIKDEDEIITDSEQEPSIDFLLKCVQELPDRYRLVFSLYVLDDYSHKEIASMLHISEGTSKSNLSRAKLLLKEKIEKSSNFDTNGYSVR